MTTKITPPSMSKAEAIDAAVKMARVTNKRIRLVSASWDRDCQDWYAVEMGVEAFRGKLPDGRVVRAHVWPDGGIDYV